MLLKLVLDKDFDGQVMDNGGNPNASPADLLKITLGELKAFEIKTSAGKVANNFTVFHNAADDSFGRRHVVVLQHGNSTPAANIYIHLSEGKYQVKVDPRHRKRALQLTLEISTFHKKMVAA